MVFREALNPTLHPVRVDTGRSPPVRARIQLLQSNPQLLRLLDVWPWRFYAPHPADGPCQILNGIVRITYVVTRGRAPECEQEWATLPEQSIERFQQRVSEPHEARRVLDVDFIEYDGKSLGPGQRTEPRPPLQQLAESFGTFIPVGGDVKARVFGEQPL